MCLSYIDVDLSVLQPVDSTMTYVDQEGSHISKWTYKKILNYLLIYSTLSIELLTSANLFYYTYRFVFHFGKELVTWQKIIVEYIRSSSLLMSLYGCYF